MDSTGNTYCYEPRRSSTFSLPPPPRQHANPDSDQVLSPPLTPSITPSISTLSANHHFKSKFPSDHPLAYQPSSAVHPTSSSPNRLVVNDPIDRRSSACSAMSLDEFNRQYWDTNRMVKENRSFSFSDRMPSRRQPSKQNKHVCNYPHCGWSFKRYEHLKRHMLVHTGERPHACPYPGCGKRFSRSDNFHAHYRTHTKKALEQQKGTSTAPGNIAVPPPPSSSETSAPPTQTFLPPPPSFDSFHHPQHHHPHHRMDQQQHQDTHHYLMSRSSSTTNGQAPPQVPAFHHHRQSYGPMEGAPPPPPGAPSSNDNMMPPPPPSSSSPSSSSDDEKQHICTHPGCHRRFKRLEHLKRHMRIHTLERPFQCTYAGCQKSFSRSDNLTQHLKTHERRESRYQEHRPYPSPYHPQQQQRPQTPNESMSFVDFMRPGGHHQPPQQHHPTSSSQHHPGAPAAPPSTSSSMQHMLSWHPGDAAGSVGC
ncbi:hypothetical protein RO3G_05476 [Lichtheimia corymbifera JMRC:FSU:9682]|uniref:C2H2-type domain-containing protein n=1 Tax=Lichtheimia corymbifera JMRC:FSU:9682 TaxID=1263082 RepID=A0A068S2Z1_9FUNG|nr:hypothetical protein RO3G_05476 [Lichtheimia corymbifera JMRC:FSU:9682]